MIYKAYIIEKITGLIQEYKLYPDENDIEELRQRIQAKGAADYKLITVDVAEE